MAQAESKFLWGCSSRKLILDSPLFYAHILLLCLYINIINTPSLVHTYRTIIQRISLTVSLTDTPLLFNSKPTELYPSIMNVCNKYYD